MSADPVRTCVGCREKAARRELLRVVVQDGVLVPDPSGRATGRGAHLHPTRTCLTLAQRRRAFPRALRCEGRVDDRVLEEYLGQVTPEPAPGTTRPKTDRNWSISS